MPSELHRRICDVVERIPAGRVATYGQIAQLAGLAGQARLVGYALHATGRSLPWHRVINARGEISRRSDRFSEDLQRRLLANEGIRFNQHGRISLKHYRWNGETPGSNPPAPEDDSP